MAGHCLTNNAELRRLDDCSGAIEYSLTHLRDRMKDSHDVADMGRIAMNATDIMLQETVGWKIQYNMLTIALA